MSKEKVGVSDTIGIVLKKANGTVITNEPESLTVEILKDVAKKYENRGIPEVDEEGNGDVPESD